MLRSSSICASFLYNYLMSDSECKDENGQPLDKKCQKLRCLSDTLESYGGVLSKLSQMLSLNDQNSTVFSDCKPFSKEKTIKYFKKFIESSSINLDFVDFDVYKSGSVGQVHKAIYKNRDIVFKVQYVGLAEQTRTDLNMLDRIASYLYYFSDMKNAMVEIKTKMYEELDYKMEASNQIKMAKIYKNSDFVEIPKIIPKLCTNTVIGMYFVKGRCLREFIDDSTQEQRDKFGMCAVKFVFENIYKHGILYSDVHYGNLLVKDDSTLCVLDFGCLHYINAKLLEHMRNLHISIRNEDKKRFYEIVEDMGIINQDISPESKKYIYDYFCIQYTPWISEEFEFTEEWLDMATDKETELMKEWVLPHDMVYFNKIPYGFVHVLTKLGMKGKFREVFDKMFEEIDH
jgi:predicted unusual protein kinase regulating ubiquinone biosynthesis (AarF/ABC1/UbiB family)